MIKRFGGLLVVAFVALLVSCDGSAGHMTTGGASHEDEYDGKCHTHYSRSGKVYRKHTDVAYLDSISSDTVKVENVLFEDCANPGRLSLRIATNLDSKAAENEVYVEIFGCETHECPEATTIVIHNKDYSYDQMIDPSDFMISKSNRDISMSSHYLIQYFFHLNIDSDDVALSWDILTWEYSSTQCPTPLKPAW